MKLSKYNSVVKSASNVTGIPEEDLYCMNLSDIKSNVVVAKNLIRKLNRKNNLEKKNEHRKI